MITVKSARTSPTAEPAIGDRHAVMGTATGGYSSKEGAIAIAADTSGDRWLFRPARPGERIIDESDGCEMFWSASRSKWCKIVAPWSVQYYTSHATPKGTERVGLFNSSSTNPTDEIPSGHVVAVTAFFMALELKLAASGTWTLQGIIRDVAAAESHQVGSDFDVVAPTTDGQYARPYFTGSLEAPLLELAAGARPIVGWKPAASCPDDLLDGPHHAKATGFLLALL